MLGIHIPDNESVRGRSAERGAAAIEFALLFIPMFALFYGLVSYGLILALVQGMTMAAEEGARAALAVDRSYYADDDAYLTDGLIPRVRQEVGASLDWLSEPIKARVLGAGNANVEVTLNGDVLEVRVAYRDYAETPLIPALRLPVIGAIPRVGDRGLEAQANIRL